MCQWRSQNEAEKAIAHLETNSLRYLRVFCINFQLLEQWFPNSFLKLCNSPLATFQMAHGPFKRSTQINMKQHVGSNPGLNFNSD